MTQDQVGRALREPALVNHAPTGHGPAGFDPAREDWSFVFEAPAGARHLRSGFWGIEAGFADPADRDPLWWDCDNRRWLADSEVPWGKNNPARTFALGSSAPCRSFAAFRRHVRKHGPKLAGHRVRLVSRWVGHDVFAALRDSDGSGEAGETALAGSTEGDSAGRKAASPNAKSVHP